MLLGQMQNALFGARARHGRYKATAMLAASTRTACERLEVRLLLASGPIVSGQPVTDQIFSPGSHNVYTFTAVKGGTIHITMEEAEGSDFDPELHLFTNTGHDFDYRFGSHSTYVDGAGDNLPYTGTYYVIAGDYGDNQVGTYTLSLTTTTGSSMPVPTAPGLAASPGSTVAPSSTSLAWTGPAGATEYGLYVSKLQPDGTFELVFDSTDPVHATVVPGDASTFLLPANVLQDGGSYRWNMNAKVSGTWGPYTSRLYFRVSTTQIPVTPTGLTATSSGPNSVDADWPDVPGATHYRLYRSASPAGPFQEIYTGSDSAYSDGPTTLEAASTYYYRVAAGNFAGDSPVSSSFVVSTGTQVKPPQPTGLQAAATGPRTIGLAWNDVTADGMYLVERSRSSAGPFVAVGRVTENVTSWVDTTLPGSIPKETFYYRVRALVADQLSDPSATASATVNANVTEIQPLPQPTPQVSANPYAGIARVYQWNWIEPTRTGANPRPQLWTEVTDLSTVNWSKKTIMLTHGWNDRLDYRVFDPTDPGGYDGDFMNIIGTEFMRGRTDPAAGYNLLAVDWFDGGSARGSDPNHAKNPDLGALGLARDITMTGQLDAQDSMSNGANAAAVLADQLAGTGVRPDRLLLVGHSNGAGFMARLAKTLYARQHVMVRELDALDAPYFTTAQFDVASAAGSISKVNNYYLPLVQFSKSPVGTTQGQAWWETALSRSAGMGGPILFQDNVTNFELSSGLPTYDLFKQSLSVVGHAQVALKFARTAGGESSETPKWGLQTAPIVSDEPDRFPGEFWLQDSSGSFNTSYTKAYAEAVVNAGAQVGAAIGTIGLAGGNAILRVSEKTLDVVNQAAETGATGIRYTVKKADDGAIWLWRNATSIFQADVPTDAASNIAISQDSAEFLSLPIDVPANTSLLGFDLSGVQSLSSGKLLVAIGNEIVGQVDLVAAGEAGGDSAVFAIDRYAGKSVTLTFLTTPDVPSDAEFVIGNLRFGSVAAGMPGDATRDGKVDFADLLALARNYNGTGKTWADGDFDGNGTVNFNDLLTLARNYNKTLPASGAAPAPAATMDVQALAAAMGIAVPTTTPTKPTPPPAPAKKPVVSPKPAPKPTPVIRAIAPSPIAKAPPASVLRDDDKAKAVFSTTRVAKPAPAKPKVVAKAKGR